MSPFDLALDAKTRLGESPVWDAAAGVLLFVDITGRRLHRFDPAGGAHQTFETAEDIGCVAPRIGGGFIAGMRTGIWRLDDQARPVERLAANPEDASVSRFNDGRVDPVGRFLAGTVDEPKAGGRAHLYRYDRRGLAVLAGGLLTSNGLAFSPDGRTLYHVDTPRFTVFAYDYDPATGQAENRRVFAQLDATAPDRARPDGAAVDADGCYWTALYEGGRVRRYDPAGRLMAEYAVPAKKPTMPAFGGADLKTLYVTTAWDDDDPTPGAVWAMGVETPGLVSLPFDPAV